MRIVQRRSIDVLRTRRLDLRSRGLSFGTRIVVASDIHARDDWFPRPHVARVVDAINAIEDADMVVLLGDFVGDDVTAIDWSAQEYARIELPTAAVLGNHDHWCDAARVERTLADVGVEVLTNRAIPLGELAPTARPSTWLAGIDSCWTRRGTTGAGADPEAAFANVPDDADAIVLGHEPHLATMHEQALHLAGHTHRGQVRSPIFGDLTARMHMPRYSEPYPTGLYEVERPGALGPRFVYTTGGVGYSTIDLRVFCPPELVVIDA